MILNSLFNPLKTRCSNERIQTQKLGNLKNDS